MICLKCGSTVDDGVIFCPFCGKKIDEMIDLEKKSAAVNDVFEPEVPPVTPVPAFSDTPRPPVTPVPAFSDTPRPPVTPVPAFSDTPKPQPRPAEEPKIAPKPTVKPEPRKKEFFGAGAFALCLVVIGLLSASTGVFAYLYFSLLGVL